MTLPFFDRAEERAALAQFVSGVEGGFGVLFGRRRCGKSRLLQESLPAGRSTYYVGDDRESAIQRAALAVEIGRRLPGFDAVRYPDWDALLSRFFREAPAGSVLALDEFPALVHAAGEFPSVLQKHLDRRPPASVHVVIAGSSQRMMQGLVLDRAAPLFGRAREILKVAPLPAGWIGQALGLRDPVAATEAFSAWGGVPRYWELASAHGGLIPAVASLVLSPLGVLHDEPRRLLLDDLRDTTQAFSVLALIGAGCHRVSEIAGRLGKPATSLARPLATLVELGLVERRVPYGSSPQDGKRTTYRLSDPFLRLWFRFVEPNRSRLEAGLVDVVARELHVALALQASSVWEDLVRDSVPRARCFGVAWGVSSSWWGPGLDRIPLELDVVAEAADGSELLVGEAKWQDAIDWPREVASLRSKVARLPFAQGRRVRLALWAKRAPRRSHGDVACFTPGDVLQSLR
jgi:hypothetical protein